MLSGIGGNFVTDVSKKRTGPIFKSKAVHEGLFTLKAEVTPHLKLITQFNQGI
jgi:hypothetical protein